MAISVNQRELGDAECPSACEAASPRLSRLSLHLPPVYIADNGKVRLGGQGPSFRAAAVEDRGKVRLGGQGPIFR